MSSSSSSSANGTNMIEWLGVTKDEYNIRKGSFLNILEEAVHNDPTDERLRIIIKEMGSVESSVYGNVISQCGFFWKQNIREGHGIPVLYLPFAQ